MDLTFVLIFIPMALIIGIAAATIGYTAWAIVVPLVFVIFGFGLYESLYLSIIIDLGNSLVLVIKYSEKGEVSFKSGMIWGSIAVAGGIVGYILSTEFIAKNQDVLKGSVGWFIILIGAFFIYKGISMKKNPQNQEEPEEQPSNVQSDSSIPNETKSNGGDETKLLRFSPIIAYSILIGGMFISGALSGLIAIGSGMNFVLVFLAAYKWNLHKATGTGLLMMLIMMVFCSIAYAPHVNFAFLWPYLIFASGISIIGTLIGAHYAFKLPKDKLNILVGITMIIAASIATIQTLIIS